MSQRPLFHIRPFAPMFSSACGSRHPSMKCSAFNVLQICRDSCQTLTTENLARSQSQHITSHKSSTEFLDLTIYQLSCGRPRTQTPFLCTSVLAYREAKASSFEVRTAVKADRLILIVPKPLSICLRWTQWTVRTSFGTLRPINHERLTALSCREACKSARRATHAVTIRRTPYFGRVS